MTAPLANVDVDDVLVVRIEPAPTAPELAAIAAAIAITLTQPVIPPSDQPEGNCWAAAGRREAMRSADGPRLGERGL